jgi:hypothetical protein
MKEWLAKLNKLSIQQKQYIVWSIVIVLGLVLVAWWVFSTAEQLKSRDWSSAKESIDFPEREESSNEDFWPEWLQDEDASLNLEEILEEDLNQEMPE